MKAAIPVMAAVALLFLGTASLAFGAIIWLSDDAPGTSSVAKHSVTTVTKPAKAETGGDTTTTVDSKDTTTPGTASLRSEAVVATLFGVGGLLLLCGLFFNRISKVTFPGGASLELIDPEAQVKVVKKAAETAAEAGLSSDPQTLAALYAAALDELAKRQPLASSRPSGWPGGTPGTGGPAGASGWGALGTSPGDDIIDEAVVAAVERVRPNR